MTKLLILISIVLIFSVQSSDAFANSHEIARWTDADGRVHFGNPQFAPPGDAEEVSVQNANGMVVPPAYQSERSSARVAYIKKAPKKNKRGWRGYNKRLKNSRSRTR